MTAEYPRFRKFVLGAGFSQLAGLPLANELFTEVRRRIESCNGPDTKFQRDVIDYMDYCKACDGVDLPITKIDLEEFMSYLYMEHRGGGVTILRGGDRLGVVLKKIWLNWGAGNSRKSQRQHGRSRSQPV